MPFVSIMFFPRDHWLVCLSVQFSNSLFTRLFDRHQCLKYGWPVTGCVQTLIFKAGRRQATSLVNAAWRHSLWSWFLEKNKIRATRCQILRLKCSKFGLRSRPRWEAYSVPLHTTAVFNGPKEREGERQEGKGKGEEQGGKLGWGIQALLFYFKHWSTLSRRRNHGCIETHPEDRCVALQSLTLTI